jgi:ADP-ribosylglycohydrolase
MIDEKCAGAFVASAIGDALGWPNEFRASNVANKKTKPTGGFVEWQRRSGGHYWSHTVKIITGEYSDDTQMNLAVARSILSGKSWVTHLSMVELPFWLGYERGGGGALKRAAELWKKKVAPWRANSPGLNRYFDAGGNGAAMRVLPHVIAGLHGEFAELAREVAHDAILTHGHPRAILGALCYAYALMYFFKKNDILTFGELANAVIAAKEDWSRFPATDDKEWLRAAEGRNYSALWSKTTDDMIAQLKLVSAALQKGALDLENETLATLGCFNKSVNGAGDVAAVTSIYLASKYANNPVLGVKSAAYAIGADTDTIASMVGGLLGALMGLSWIPAEWKIVQDYDCLVRMAQFLIAEDGVAAVKEYVARALIENDDWEQSPIGKLRKTATMSLPGGRTGTVKINKYVTILGQTIYKKDMSTDKIVGQCNDGYQQSLPKKRLLRFDSQRICDIRANAELAKVNLDQLCTVIERVSFGVSDYRLIANESGMSEATARSIMGLITWD